MGWSFRRSFNLGPLRINLGKRGIGTSLGAGPIRIGRSATGRTFRSFRIPATGISYRSGGGCLGLVVLSTGAVAALMACAMRAGNWLP